jgi:hypothetical protein
MRTPLRLLPVVAVTLLLGASPAAAHHWDDGQWDDGGDWSSQPQDPSWTNSGQSWDDAPDWDAPGPDSSGEGWNPNEGDAQENPAGWVQAPSPDTGRRNDRERWHDWPTVEPLPISRTPTVSGKTAMLRRNGLAAIPRRAPARVRAILTAANQIIGRPTSGAVATAGSSTPATTARAR